MGGEPNCAVEIIKNGHAGQSTTCKFKVRMLMWGAARVIPIERPSFGRVIMPGERVDNSCGVAVVSI